MKDAKGAIKYVGRYTEKLAIAESRIIKYYGKKITFVYARHDDNKRVRGFRVY